MKLTYRQIEPFVKSPDPAARVILVYGPDSGLMRERAKNIASTIVEDLSDPFNVCVLSADQLIEDPARLNDEAKALSMMGGARLIRIEAASDKISPLLRDYLDEPSSENLVIVEAGELGPRSPLRQLCEKAKNAASLPCYVEGERDIAQLARTKLQEQGYRIDQDALNWLSANIAGDRGRANSEIEKLSLYKGDDQNSINLSDVQAACGEAGAQSLDDLIYAVGSAQKEQALRSFSKLLQEGVPVMMILRSLQNHFRRLHYTHAHIKDGASIDQAMKALQPPVFFKFEQSFKAQLNRLNLPTLQKILQRLNELEAQTKQSGAPVETLCAQAILSLSSIRS